MMIRDAKPEDEKWVGAIFKKADHILGKGFFGTIWWRYWNQGTPSEFWIVIPDIAFAHYKVRKDGVRALYEIAVEEGHKRQGYGKALLRHIGFPMELKTDANHEESNRFYKACGFYPAGEKRSRDGTKRLRIWVCAQ